MKCYKNITSYPIAIDCMTHTKYVGPGEIVTLPTTRDVRYYSGRKQLVVVKDRPEKKPIPVASFKTPKKADKPKDDPIIESESDPIIEEVSLEEAPAPKKKRVKKPKKAEKEEQNEKPINNIGD